ncbi:hypothetical protein EZS27_020301 [termite gut metagenome]|uniref:TIR domain-containing protein n=1 Tax=termite gut metagenome TaxID=433724 RepID=A0A5J4RDX1_9ZZZZ
MSSIYSSSYLKDLAKSKNLNESQRMFSAKNESHTSFDIFLSHSFLDKDEVEGLYIELTRMGFKVYVDWVIDPYLDRNNVIKTTATLIRNRLKSSKTLLLAISVNASVSKWMPWELGYVDGYTNKCAIIPVSRENLPASSYKGSEYLSLYPFIKKVRDTNNKERLWVIEESNKYVLFDSWLVGSQPINQNVPIF